MSIFDLPRPLEWMDDARCRETDPAIFHPEKGQSLKPAKKVCAKCEVQPDCLAWALKNDERYGVLGGLGEQERKDLRRKTRRRTGRPLQPIAHGTDRGAAQHRRRGEPVCDHCAAAASAAWKARAPRDVCPVCGDEMLRTSLPRHVERRHPDAQEDVAS